MREPLAFNVLLRLPQSSVRYLQEIVQEIISKQLIINFSSKT